MVFKKMGLEPVIGDSGPHPAVSTGSFVIDTVIGGTPVNGVPICPGFPRKKITELFGNESSGKCLTLDALISTTSGLLTLEEIFEACEVDINNKPQFYPCKPFTLLNRYNKAEYIGALSVNGRQALTSLHLEDGTVIKSTYNHPHLVKKHDTFMWVKARDIEVGDCLVAPREIPSFGAEGCLEELAYFWGVVFAIGRKNHASDIPTVLADESPLVQALMYGQSIYGGSREGVSFQIPEHSDFPFTEQRLPQKIRMFDRPTLSHFLAGYIDAAAHSHPLGLYVPVRSYEQAMDIKLLLRSFGIHSTVEPYLDLSRTGHRLLIQEPHLPQRIPLKRGIEYPAKTGWLDETLLLQVTKKQDLPAEPTFDLVMPSTHSFLAQGVITHNTTVCLSAIAKLQKEGGSALYLDFEHAIDHAYAKSIGVDFVNGCKLYAPNTMEDGLKIAYGGICTGVDLIVIDSLAAMVPQAELEKGIDDNAKVGAVAKKLAEMLPKFANWLDTKAPKGTQGTALIWINQMRALISSAPSYGGDEANTNTAGGKALKFYCSLRLKLTRTKSEMIEKTDPLTGKKKNAPYGNVVEVRVVKNKVNGTQGHKGNFFIRFGSGVDEVRSVIEAATANGLVKRSGAKYTLGAQDFRGQEAFRRWLLANPGEYQTLYEATMKAVVEAAPTSIADDEIDEEDEISEALEEFGADPPALDVNLDDVDGEALEKYPIPECKSPLGP